MNRAIPATLRSIAREIETYGHFKGGYDEILYERFNNPQGKRCLVRNEQFYREGNQSLAAEAQDIMAKELTGQVSRKALIEYSDKTPTNEVCDKLRDLADRIEQTDI